MSLAVVGDGVDESVACRSIIGVDEGVPVLEPGCKLGVLLGILSICLGLLYGGFGGCDGLDLRIGGGASGCKSQNQNKSFHCYKC